MGRGQDARPSRGRSDRHWRKYWDWESDVQGLNGLFVLNVFCGRGFDLVTRRF